MENIDAFLEMDIVVGIIKAVEDHPNADRLYVLRVDVGDKTITLVAGLKKYYSKEELIGKRILVVKNLKPKNFRGITSQGMLLAADNGEEVGVLTTDRKVRAGTRVKV